MRIPLFMHLGLLLLFVQAGFAQASSGIVVPQDTLNRVDELGRKQGWWRIVAPAKDKPGYQDGQLVEEGQYTNSKRVGVWRSYWPNGEPRSVITYQLGRPRGEYTLYYPSGRTEETGTWDYDRNTGTFKRWHPNGKLAQEFVFDEHGMRDGQQKYYHDNGQLAVDVTIRQGREEGTLKRYYNNGDLQQVAEFNGGVINEANSRYLKPARQVQPEAVPDVPVKAAPAVEPEEGTNVTLFKRNGYNTLYDKQLRITQQGEYREGRLWNGRFYRYDRNGLLYRIEVYQEGRYIGDKPITDEDLP
ncbi:MAG TPA: toxin-antitoxin system YwqK family antitoxin [Flavobacteriales bacterium]|nr:toxin-antitoxin system YwqK family antitoxin [Flavobacteriales bacterium]MCB0816816.1 toxin-antitoxin system YwqK family antitoxin [Flavobacteriales bacterium]MCB9182227.1 toxin-antitoxin system YwqK family antitoxin [Flavobacteriales bacterium]MCB9200696.1 toxin-antitoxin system YwqK family antitoxin [Flavobacteriales bacterium]HOP43014.1 toxin-antitoxin system YwqK family antitoxin [Flavobacteriales bacterium]